jgi:hypothetical protein
MGMVFLDGYVLKVMGRFRTRLFGLLVVGLNNIFFLVWHYSGIIRHSTFNDLLKIFAAQSATFAFCFTNIKRGIWGRNYF